MGALAGVETAAAGTEGGWWMIGTDAVGCVGPVSRPPSKSKLRPPSPSSMARNVCIGCTYCVCDYVCDSEANLGLFGEEGF